MSAYKNDDTASWDVQQVRSNGQSHSSGPSHSSGGQRRPRRRRRRMNPMLYLVLVLASSAVLAGIGWLLINDLCSLNKPEVTVTVEVTADDNLSSVAKKLHEAGLVKYRWFFKLVGGVANADEKIGIGTYSLNSNMDYLALISAMRNSSGNLKAETVKVTIPEGYTVAQTIQLLASKGVNTAEALTEAAQTATFEYDFIDNDSEETSRLEGYLFPDTYEFYVGEKPASALNRLIKNFNNKMNADRMGMVEDSKYTLEQIITIASLIEKETDGGDQAKIASVIYNRLDGPGDKAGTYGMLQIDASLLYALPGHTGAITSEELKTDSKYNLSKYAGLPPTAIANPGLDSIIAALEPETTDYYYYALGKDGKHRFFTNYNDHVNFVKSSDYIGN